ncbi:MAG: polyprenyl synthetase family protein [Bacteroidetes bacterium]|nr:polyprenyl synthetase family protein [Bacteroidota bacterium]
MPAAITLEDIQQPIAEELEHFERHFRKAVKSRILLLDKIMHYMIRRKGKQMRPMFVLLSAQLTGGISPATYRGAALIELLHTATLIHDDVVDDADERRGFFSINALWKNKIAVLIGDFLLSRGLLMSLEHDDFQLLKITSRAVKLMSEGELLQMEKARRLNIDEVVYFDIIRQKTASLIAACCESGAASAGASPETVEQLRRFGELVGMAFQIKDDLFDYGGSRSGKPVGIDLKEKKMTLPLIHTLNKSSWLERRRLIHIVRHQSNKPKQVKYLVDFVKAAGGISYSEQTMHRFADEALAILDTLPSGPANTSLRQLVNYTIERDK